MKLSFSTILLASIFLGCGTTQNSKISATTGQGAPVPIQTYRLDPGNNSLAVTMSATVTAADLFLVPADSSGEEAVAKLSLNSLTSATADTITQTVVLSLADASQVADHKPFILTNSIFE